MQRTWWQEAGTIIVTGPYYPLVNATVLDWWQVNSDSGDGLMTSGRKPLPEPMLTQFYISIWHHQHQGVMTGLAFTKSPNRKRLGKEYKGLETFDVSSPILSCFLGQLWQNFQISQKWDLKSQQPSTNPEWVKNYMIRITFNLLWSGDAIWQNRSGSTLAQIMACCPMAPSHYLNQCWIYYHQ